MSNSSETNLHLKNMEELLVKLLVNQKRDIVLRTLRNAVLCQIEVVILVDSKSDSGRSYCSNTSRTNLTYIKSRPRSRSRYGHITKWSRSRA